MLIYQNSGVRDFTAESVPVNSRSAWEFFVCLSGGIAPAFLDRRAASTLRARTMWVFPRDHAHGWVGTDRSDRIVFHFTAVPGELEHLIPPRGYYRADLTDEDCDRIRKLNELATAIMARPTELVFLQTQALVTELSLIVLREANQPPLASHHIARNRTEQALTWYREHISEAPRFERIAAAVHVSPTHLRRLFHQVMGEGPHRAFNRIRMKMAEDLLKGTDLTLDAMAPQLGFSNGSALSRAVKAHFGITPRDLRRGKRPLRMYT